MSARARAAQVSNLWSRRNAGRAALVFVVLFGALIFGGAGCQRSRSSDYPNRSIELIVPWAAGGGTDRLARFIADALQRALKQPVIVVNRTGGSGAVGHSAGSLAPPDGYTVTMATFELSTMRAMGISKLTWQDFTPVAQINGDAAAILVRQDAKWAGLPEFLDAIRKEPGRLKMSGTATGGAWDLARTGLLLAAGIGPRDVIWAPTQGSAPALVELLGGHIDAVCCSVPEAASQIEAKQVRVLAVLSPKRLPHFPEFATAREQGIAYDAVGWRGIMLPRNTPQEIANVLNEKLVEITRSKEFHDFMNKNGFTIEVRGPAEFAHYLREQELKWGEVIEKAGYQTLGHNHDPGPRAMPILLAALLTVVLAGEAIASRRRRARQPADAARATAAGRLSIDAWFVLAALGLYLIVMPWVGFAFSTVVFAVAVMWRLGAKWWLAAVCSVAMVAGIHALFTMLFKVQLP